MTAYTEFGKAIIAQIDAANFVKAAANDKKRTSSNKYNADAAAEAAATAKTSA